MGHHRCWGNGNIFQVEFVLHASKGKVFWDVWVGKGLCVSKNDTW